jgi:uncharacterized membrane protein YeaQ/YmgE (transglycosylase-associated protein family)
MTIDLGKLIVWIIIGLIAGLLAGRIAWGTRFSTPMAIFIGILGAIVGSLLFSALRIPLPAFLQTSISLGDILIAFVGALIVLVIVGFIDRRRV